MSQKRLDEFSLTQLSKRKDFNLASPTTRHFSTERRGIMGDAPKTTKLIDIQLDKEKDYVTFYFLTEATEKYGPDYQYKDSDPNASFQLERDPSKTYEIWLRFYKVSQLYTLSQSRVSKKAYNPTNTKITTPVKKLSLDEVKAWLWSTDFAVWSNSPSFHWQGFNYNLSRLHASIFPTNIAPTNKHKTNGRTVMGWKGVHGSALIDKHLLDLFIHIKFFINQMAGMLIRRVRNPGAPPEPARTPQPIGMPVKPQTAQKQGEIPTEEPPQAPVSGPTPIVQQNKQVQPQEPQVDIKQRNDMNTDNSQIDQYPGNPNENPETYEADADENIPENIIWNINPYGYQFEERINGKRYTTQLITKIEYFQNDIMALDESNNYFENEFSENVPWEARYDLYNRAKKLSEVTISMDQGMERQRYSHIIEEILDFLKECEYDIVTFKGTMELPIQAKTIKIITEAIQLAMPKYKIVRSYSRKSNNFNVYLIKESKIVKVLQEAEGNNPNTKPEDKQNNIPDEKNNIPDEKNKDIPPKNKEDHTLVFAFGSFNPPTANHLKMIDKVKKTAELQKANALVFIQRDPDFLQDAMSLEQRKLVLQKLTGIPVCIDNDITDFTSALNWAYNHHYNNIMVISSNDEVKDMTALIQNNNDKETNEGHFKFDNYKVASYGGDNPDQSSESIEAVNAMMDNDIDAYLKAIDLPYIAPLKKLFILGRYELQNRIGMTESIALKEIEIESTIAAINRGRAQRYIDALSTANYGMLGNAIHAVGSLKPLPYEVVLQKFRQETRKGPDPQRDNAFKLLLQHFYPNEYMSKSHAPF